MAKANRKSAPAPTALALVTPEATPTPKEFTQEDRLRALMEVAMGGGRDSEFALSLLVAIRKGKVSEKQQFHADRIANAHLNPLPTITCTRVIEAYKALPQGMKRYPKVRSVIGGVEVTLSYTAPTSDKAKPENRGTCAIASGKWGTPESKYYGRIMQDGTFVAGHDLTPEVREWIASLSHPDATMVWQY